MKSILRPLVVSALLMMALLLSRCAHADYTVLYSGGYLTYNSGGFGYSHTSNSGWGAATGGFAFSSPSIVDCSGTITATFTWLSNDPLPPAIWIKQTCVATAELDGSAAGVCTADDGLGDPQQIVFQDANDLSVSSSGTRYTLVLNPTAYFTITCTPAATASPSMLYTTYSAGITYTASASTNTPSASLDLQAWSTAGTVDLHHPKWFSFTNCGAQGSAGTTGGYIASEQLLINGTVVNSYSDDGSHSTSHTLKVAFDSTHFVDGSAITVELRLTDSNGIQYRTSLTAPAYNKAYIYGNQLPPDGIGSLPSGEVAVNNANASFDFAEHSILPSVDPSGLQIHQWHLPTPPNPNDFINYIPQSTVMYCWSHGYTDAISLSEVGDSAIGLGQGISSTHFVNSNNTTQYV